MTKQTQELGKHLLKWASKEVEKHFKKAKKDGFKESTWISGFLEDVDIKRLERKGDKIRCSTESGEYFYKITFK